MVQRTATALVGAATVGALLLAPALVYPYFEDPALFAAVARYMLGGAALYRDVFDHKAPAIYLLEVGRLWLLGPSALASRCFELTLLLASGLGLGAAAYARGAEPGGSDRAWFFLLCATSFAALASSALWGLPERGQVEFYQAAFVAAGLSAAIHAVERDRPAPAAALAGGLLGWAAWLKPQAALLMVGVWLILGVEDWRRKGHFQRSWAFPMGAGLVSMGVVGWLYAASSLEGFWFVFSQHHPAYLGSIRHAPIEFLFRYQALLLDTPRTWVVALLVLLGTLNLARQAHDGRWRWCTWALVMTTQVWGIVAFATGGFGFFYHAIPSIVAPAFLSAVGVDSILAQARRIGQPAGRTIAHAAVLVAGLSLVLTPHFRDDARDFSRLLAGNLSLDALYARRGRELHYYSYAAEREGARVVQRMVPEGQTFYVLGLSAVTYLFSGRSPAGRHLVTIFAHMPGYALAPQVRAEVVDTIRRGRPQVLLVRANDAFPWFGVPATSMQRLLRDEQLRDVVQGNYAAVGKIGNYFYVLQRCATEGCPPSGGPRPSAR